jgi:hypothetical protein
VFTARYGLSPFVKQIRFVFKGLKQQDMSVDGVCLGEVIDWLTGFCKYRIEISVFIRASNFMIS